MNGSNIADLDAERAAVALEEQIAAYARHVFCCGQSGGVVAVVLRPSDAAAIAAALMMFREPGRHR